ncbi:hypothetical protein TNCV_4189681 [Trichonephila clavipes]|nr:hypothetical protein TNCV_4189681 [Trichonephila clavipes]
MIVIRLADCVDIILPPRILPFVEPYTWPVSSKIIPDAQSPPVAIMRKFGEGVIVLPSSVARQPGVGLGLLKKPFLGQPSC